MKIIESDFNITTGKETITEREETAAEIKAREAAQAKFLAEQAETQAKETAKTALLAKLGITAEEAVLLLS
jgi:hypothetical protein